MSGIDIGVRWQNSGSRSRILLPAWTKPLSANGSRGWPSGNLIPWPSNSNHRSLPDLVRGSAAGNILAGGEAAGFWFWAPVAKPGAASVFDWPTPSGRPFFSLKDHHHGRENESPRLPAVFRRNLAAIVGQVVAMSEMRRDVRSGNSI